MLLTEYYKGEFRDPSTFPSFYYPPEGPDTEREQQKAESDALAAMQKDVDAFNAQFAEKYTGIDIDTDAEVIDEENLYGGRDDYQFAETVKCTVTFTMPAKYLDGAAERLLDLEIDVCEDFGDASKSGIDYDDSNSKIENDKIVITTSGKIKFKY